MPQRSTLTTDPPPAMFETFQCMAFHYCMIAIDCMSSGYSSCSSSCCSSSSSFSSWWWCSMMVSVYSSDLSWWALYLRLRRVNDHFSNAKRMETTTQRAVVHLTNCPGLNPWDLRKTTKGRRKWLDSYPPVLARWGYLPTLEDPNPSPETNESKVEMFWIKNGEEMHMRHVHYLIISKYWLSYAFILMCIKLYQYVSKKVPDSPASWIAIYRKVYP